MAEILEGLPLGLIILVIGYFYLRAKRRKAEEERAHDARQRRFREAREAKYNAAVRRFKLPMSGQFNRFDVMFRVECLDAMHAAEIDTGFDSARQVHEDAGVIWNYRGW
jgi:hypothetical protein